jgi:hypothetical protein
VSEDVVLGAELGTGVFFTLYAEGVMILLDRSGAAKLRDELNEFLGADKQASGWKVGDLIPKGSDEPDLPIGSKIKDNSEYGDIAVRTEGGWRWATVMGSANDERVPWRWRLFANDFNFTVVEIGSGA